MPSVACSWQRVLSPWSLVRRISEYFFWAWPRFSIKQSWSTILSIWTSSGMENCPWLTLIFISVTLLIQIVWRILVAVLNSTCCDSFIVETMNILFIEQFLVKPWGVKTCLTVFFKHFFQQQTVNNLFFVGGTVHSVFKTHCICYLIPVVHISWTENFTWCWDIGLKRWTYASFLYHCSQLLLVLLAISC